MGLFKFLGRLLFGTPPPDTQPTDSGAPADTANRDFTSPLTEGSSGQSPGPNWIDGGAVGGVGIGGFQANTNSGGQSGPVNIIPAGEPLSPTSAAESSVSQQTSAAVPSSVDSSPSQSQQPNPELLSGLDTERFAPLTADDALAQTKGADWRTAYWDRLNVIPPADLPRIRVIDGTMVGMGLISSEELAEIHDIGEQMDAYRSDAHQIEAAGHAAVRQSREERQRIKDEKKREAAARKEAHQKAVAHRRATDIIFLGRGVSKGLTDRRANVELLSANELPVLATPADVAQAMDISIPTLRWLAFHTESATRTHYITFSIPKKSGGQRKISRPHVKLAAAQRWILENVLVKIPSHDAAHGFVPGRSIVTNAAKHVHQDLVVNVDLKDFFPSVHFYRVDGLFRSLGYSPAVATIFALICTDSPRETVRFSGETYHVATGKPALPQGACTSPAISNLVTRHLDKRFQGIANKLDWNYTRYADDLTFSSTQSDEHEKEKQVGYLLTRIRHIAKEEGFAVNEKKTRILRNHTRQCVTGVTVNDKINVSRRTIRSLRAILHNARRDGLESQNRDGHPNFRNWLNGMIAWVEMVNPERGRQLRTMYSEIG